MVVLRSEALRRGTLIVPSEKARAFVDAAGEELQIQFEDMNAETGLRPFKRVSARLDEIQRKLRLSVDRLEVQERTNLTAAMIDSFLQTTCATMKIETVEAEIERLFSTTHDLKANNDEITSQLTAALKERAVLVLAKSMLAVQSTSRPVGESLLQVSAVAGVVNKVDEERLKRMVFRASRGNVFLFSEDAEIGAVFVCYFQGGDQTAMRDKIVRICQGFGVSLFEWPDSGETADRRHANICRTIAEKQTVLRKFTDFRASQISEYFRVSVESGLTRLEELRLFVNKEAHLYRTLNFFSGDRFILRCDCWLPELSIGEIQQRLSSVGAQVGVQASLLLDKPVDITQLHFGHGEGPNDTLPPTYIKKNELTSVFQELVNTYGIPRYQEVNPGLFTVVSFPFIFGVMYGDVGHGSILLALGLFLVFNADKAKSGHFGSAVQAMAEIRYLVMMMGFFAVYAGFMYNDFLSMGMRLFGQSRFDAETGMPEPWFNRENALADHESAHGPYMFGLDPGWHGAQNELLYVNSYKMKLSVILGVAQMLLGVMLKFVNALHFRSKIDLVCECVPQLVFMLAIFGYMDWMIMYKWTHVVDDPPSIINTLINMGLGQQEKMPLYSSQGYFQHNLLNLAIWAVPVMLIPKPLFLWYQHRASRGQAAGHSLEEGGGHKGGAKEEEFEIGEIVIHQIIETIEYVLGTVSHASSYLRQWALSLAHQQLSLVFFSKILTPALSAENSLLSPLYIYVAFAIFMGVTTGVLLGMDVLECFLHTLRLHWVEFQSKFYKADGKLFAPFSHKTGLLGDAQ